MYICEYETTIYNQFNKKQGKDKISVLRANKIMSHHNAIKILRTYIDERNICNIKPFPLVFPNQQSAEKASH